MILICFQKVIALSVHIDSQCSVFRLARTQIVISVFQQELETLGWQKLLHSNANLSITGCSMGNFVAQACLDWHDSCDKQPVGKGEF